MTKCQIYLTNSCTFAPSCHSRPIPAVRARPALQAPRALFAPCPASRPARPAPYGSKRHFRAMSPRRGIFHIFAACICGDLHKLFLLSNPISHTIPTSSSHQRSLPGALLFSQQGSQSRQKNNEAIADGLAMPFSEKPSVSRLRYLFVSNAQNHLTNNARYGTIEPQEIRIFS